MSNQFYSLFLFWIGILLFLTSCGMGSEEKCISLLKNSNAESLDTLVIDSPNRNKIYHAELCLTGELVDTVKLGIHPNFQVMLFPGNYDSLIYKGDWYGDPMVLKTEGGMGSQMEFCAKFFY
ncbi:hypothetical protein [Algoriphagus taiwanensis]|uniref:Lipoprotein n=1 Tax=Algoriphagus taiwanensis TaxID=1445656 RepID=A0ABQ6PXH2_9BACT|nr:hypothetical protein Ataiwa_02670 [Algoriphagus taiwanensis]